MKHSIQEYFLHYTVNFLSISLLNSKKNIKNGIDQPTDM